MNVQSSLFREVSTETIRDIFSHALQENEIWDAKLLDGGLFNTTYIVEYGLRHLKAVLRLGPVNRHLLMGFEENLMAAEKHVYSVCGSLEIACSTVLACDTSKQVVDRDFMIVDYIPSVAMVNAELSEKQRNHLYVQIGKLLAKLHSVTGDSFGFVSRICDGMAFQKWSDALIFEVEDISERLERLGGLTGGEARLVRQLYEQSRELLDEVKVPHLLHTDLWEGNVLLDNETQEIAAVIDCDRAMYGDVDFELACPWMDHPGIREGYGLAAQEPLSPGRVKRRQLYQIFFCLLEAYVWYGEYNNMELYRERKNQLKELVSAFC